MCFPDATDDDMVLTRAERPLLCLVCFLGDFPFGFVGSGTTHGDASMGAKARLRKRLGREPTREEVRDREIRYTPFSTKVTYWQPP